MLLADNELISLLPFKKDQKKLKFLRKDGYSVQYLVRPVKQTAIGVPHQNQTCLIDI
jgi:hypothetical protein